MKRAHCYYMVLLPAFAAGLASLIYDPYYQPILPSRPCCCPCLLPGPSAGIFYYMGLATGFYHLGLAVGRQPFLLPGPCSSPPPFHATWALLPVFPPSFPIIWPLLPPFLHYWLFLLHEPCQQFSFIHGLYFRLSFIHELWHQPYPRKSFIFTG